MNEPPWVRVPWSRTWHIGASEFSYSIHMLCELTISKASWTDEPAFLQQAEEPKHRCRKCERRMAEIAA